MAIGVLHAARQRGLRVPDDLSVVGFDDIRFAQYVDPPLTTIRAADARARARRPCGCCSTSCAATSRTAVSVTLPHALIVRASTAAPRARARR